MRYSSGLPFAPSRMPMSSQLAFMHSLLERLAQPDDAAQQRGDRENPE